LIYTTISAKYREELGPRPPPVIAGVSAPPAPVSSPPAPTTGGSAAPAVDQTARDCSQNKDSALRVRACTAWIAANPNVQPKSLSLAYQYRGLGNAGLENNQPALADYDKAIALDSANVDAYYYRGQMNSYLDRYREAERDFRKSLDLFLPVSTAKPTEGNKNFVATLQRRIARAKKDAELEERWVVYLQDIQKRNRYSNWAGPPYDLYKKRLADR
jgi:tetratricopeptide (TPR) repeat protein